MKDRDGSVFTAGRIELGWSSPAKSVPALVVTPPVGEQVGMAQRMESVAPPGGVMLSESTARLVAHTAGAR